MYCNLLAFRYCLHGFEGREVGAYRQTADHLGHGAQIRKFKHKTQYQVQNIPKHVLNKAYGKDGKLRGSGSRALEASTGTRTSKIRSQPSSSADTGCRAADAKCGDQLLCTVQGIPRGTVEAPTIFFDLLKIVVALCRAK